ncbi:hypothetical protein COV05_01875 [Candidatus Uhrbacteria bacterium CG10_big_fil_rev_8_21_14_0_10_48_16]|uniref:DUF5050 domain-containing protein n=1 Tax=Candidatus Uhrbacteria bacterium CG10_big_fil_rev_8_21_14_0_10_48_16 TaxID=1975038 RepID=A0A2M8LHK4_9BACT|nr:MAG: hypothetical protein COV05_01875 [Candidatus Uhrbacteria bacterium CG10_big_fil_rev_8_21_14_0_10_48_16]
MIKKTLILAVAIAIGVSPLLPRVFADSGEWSNNVAEAAWDYDYYRVERLAFGDMSGPYDFNDAVFVTKTAESCAYPELCDLVDMTILKDGESFEITDVGEQVTDVFWYTAQDGRFIYRVPSTEDDSWGTVYEYDTQTGSVSKITDIERDENSMAFMTFATDGDRLYFSTLHEDEETGEVESELSVYDYETDYGRDDFTYQLTAPWQEIVDVQDGLALVKFQFSGGFQQLWLIDQTARSMEAIPETWTESPGEIVGAHFVSDGSVQFFKNFRLWSYDPETDTAPTDAGGAYLTWLMDVQEAIQIVGDRMAYIDDENGLYVSDAGGVSKFGVALNGTFNLDKDAIYFQNNEGEYVGYTFSTMTWQTRAYQVTDTYEDILVGLDADGDIWYENTTTGYYLNIGYGTAPVLSDRDHAYWKGTDGNIYQVTFSPLLDLERENVEAFSAYDASGIYLVTDGSIWLIPDETVYFTWFDSWNETLDVSQATIDAYLSSYEFRGDLKIAPGTRVKATTSTKVFVVGSDYKLHWITSETVANDIYGSGWNQGIVEVNDTYLWKYATGDDVNSSDDVRSI